MSVEDLVHEWFSNNFTVICDRLKARFRAEFCVEFQSQMVNSVICKGCDNYMEELPKIPHSFVPTSGDHYKKTDIQKHYVIPEVHHN